MNSSNGIAITWLGHATVLYRSPQGKAVLVDPWIEGNPSSPPEAKKLAGVDLLLITHGHGDHINDVVPLATKFSPDIVCNYEISLYFEKKKLEKVQGIQKSGTIELNGIKVTMVHAIHSSSIEEGDQLIYAGEPCGFVIQFEDGTKVYHTGDTGFFGDMEWIGKLYQPSIAVMPIGGHYTMGPREAAVAARLTGVKHVLPIHYGTFPILNGTPAELKRHLAAEKAEVHVIEAKPGETVEPGLARRN